MLCHSSSIVFQRPPLRRYFKLVKISQADPVEAMKSISLRRGTSSQTDPWVYRIVVSTLIVNVLLPTPFRIIAIEGLRQACKIF